MPPRNRRQKQLADARVQKAKPKEILPPQPQRVDTDLFVLQTLQEGSTYTKESRRFNSVGIEVPSADILSKATSYWAENY